MQSPGLIGALEEREREKAASRHGMRTGAVQQAIAARQQQQMQAEMQAQMQAQYQMQQAAHAGQAAHAAQAAQYQGHFAQQVFANTANVQQHAPSQYGYDQRPAMSQHRSSLYGQYGQQGGGWQSPGAFQQSNRSSYYNGHSNQQG